MAVTAGAAFAVLVMVMFMLMIVVIIVVIVVVVMMMLMFVLIFLACFLKCLCPACGSCCFFKVICTCVENIGNSYLAEAYLNNSCLGLEDFNHSLNSAKLLGCYLVHLVDDNCGAELDLLDKKIFDILFVNVFLKKIVAAAKFGSHSQRINNGNDVVKTADRRILLVSLAFKDRN